MVGTRETGAEDRHEHGFQRFEEEKTNVVCPGCDTISKEKKGRLVECKNAECKLLWRSEDEEDQVIPSIPPKSQRYTTSARLESRIQIVGEEDEKPGMFKRVIIRYIKNDQTRRDSSVKRRRVSESIPISRHKPESPPVKRVVADGAPPPLPDPVLSISVHVGGDTNNDPIDNTNRRDLPRFTKSSVSPNPPPPYLDTLRAYINRSLNLMSNSAKLQGPTMNDVALQPAQGTFTLFDYAPLGSMSSSLSKLESNGPAPCVPTSLNVEDWFSFFGIDDDLRTMNSDWSNLGYGDMRHSETEEHQRQDFGNENKRAARWPDRASSSDALKLATNMSTWRARPTTPDPSSRLSYTRPTMLLSSPEPVYIPLNQEDMNSTFYLAENNTEEQPSTWKEMSPNTAAAEWNPHCMDYDGGDLPDSFELLNA